MHCLEIRRMRSLVFSVVVAAASLLAAAVPVSAQLSSPSSTNAGSTCTGGNNADRSCGNSAAVTINTSAQIQGRYAWNINADVGPGSTRDTSGTAQHNVSFSAVAPGSYQLSITNTRVGMVQRNEDIINCEGQAHMGALSGSSNVAFTTGGLGLGAVDVNNGTGTAQTPVSQSNSATILRVATGRRSRTTSPSRGAARCAATPARQPSVWASRTAGRPRAGPASIPAIPVVRSRSTATS